jgi:transketolase
MRDSTMTAASVPQNIERHASPASPVQELVAEVTQAARFARQHAIAAIFHAGSGHPGGALSSADIIASLFGAELNLWPDTIDDPDRDRFVLSKGHAAPMLYAVAAHYGYCKPRDALRLRRLNSPFQGHPHVGDLPWVETSTGSLGQGFSVALGMAMGLKLQNQISRVYTLLGDGELQEGEVWEAIMCASHHRLDNLCVIIDYNKLQSDDQNANIMALEPLAAKWRAFDWAVAEIDGHDIPTILTTLRRAAATHGRPSCIIAHTTKGKGVPYMENVPAWHGSVKLTEAQADEALRALGASRQEIKDWLDGSDL